MNQETRDQLRLTLGPLVEAGLKFGGLLLWGIATYQGLKYNGFPKGLLFAIPVLGQLMWAGVRWASEGFFNTYTYLFLAVGVLALVHPFLRLR